MSFDSPYQLAIHSSSPIAIFPLDANRATGSTSTSSTSSIDTPVQDRFVVQPTPTIADDESCQSLHQGTSYLYSGQAGQLYVPMPSESLDCFQPCLNGDGVIINRQHYPCPCPSGPSVFLPRARARHTQSQASHVYPPSLLQHHRHTETTMNVVYDLTHATTKSTQTSTTTMTTHHTGLASSAHPCSTLAPNHCPSYARPPLVRSKLASNGWQPQNTSSCHPFPSYVPPASRPTSFVPSVPLYHPKPVHPLPHWTKKSSIVPDGLFSGEFIKVNSSTMPAHAVRPLPRETDAYYLGEQWNYGAATMIDPQDSNHNGDDDGYDDYDEDDEDDNEDDEYDEDEETDMDVHSGIDVSEYHATPRRPAPFRGTLSSAAVPLSSSSLLCQPLPDFVQNQFRASAV